MMYTSLHNNARLHILFNKEKKILIGCPEIINCLSKKQTKSIQKRTTYKAVEKQLWRSG